VQEIYIYKVTDVLIVDYRCRALCKTPYYNHPKGCPSFGKHDECPPKAPLVRDVFDFDKDFYFITEEFNLEKHAYEMKLKHPHWSERQCRNLLYWQGGVRKRLKEKTEDFIYFSRGEMIYTLLPEAMGVMVIDTALKAGIPIEKTPTWKVIKISLVGYPHPNPLKKLLRKDQFIRKDK